MQSDNILKLTVGAVLGVVLLFSLALPLLAESASSINTFENKGAFYVELNPTDAYTIKYDKDTELGVVYINDVKMDIPFSTGYTILALDQSILRLQSTDNTIQYKGNGSYITGITQLDITISEGTVSGTFTKNAVQSSWPETTYETAYIASPTEQNYIMTEYNTTVKMKGDSDIFALGQTGINSVAYLVKIEGNIDDGVTVTILNGTSGAVVDSAEISNLSVNATPVFGYVDLYNLSSITFDITISDATQAASYSAYIVPAEVTATKSVYLDSASAAMVNIIPIVLMAALLLGIVGYAVRARLS